MWARGARSPEAPTEPFDGHTGQDVGVHERDEGFQRLAPYARGAPRQAGDLQHHHQPGDRVGQKGADAAGVAEHQIALQGLQIAGRDRGVGQQAEAGVDAIDGAALGDDGGDGRGALLDTGPGVGRSVRR
jgi:hypothetical protein